MNSKLKKFNPAVDKRLLIFVSGLLWSIVGIMLCKLAVSWLTASGRQDGVWPGVTGVVLAILIYYFGFLKLVNKNTSRILAKGGKICIFAFQPWKSYLIILVMIGMGTALRHSPIPKPYLAIIYIGFGGAMVLSSLIYYRHFFSKQR